jgi:hypothetical protein
MRYCKVCKKEINRGYHGHILSTYCSDKCKFIGRKTGPSKRGLCKNCNKEFKFYLSQNKKFCSKNCKDKFQKGENSPRWNGGTCSERHAAMSRKEYKLWRTAVFERDNYTCIWCGKRGGNLQADHIKPWALYPELRYAIDNGRTLCVECHKTTDTFKFSKMYLNKGLRQ